jgi:hypothetical protein
MKGGPLVDRLGVWASAMCAVHCVLTGVALGLLSVAGLGFLHSALTEWGFFTVALVLGIVAVWHGRRRHHSVVPALIFVLGLSFILVSHFGFHHHGIGGTVFAVAGGLSLVGFHVVNMRLQHGCSCSTCQHVEEHAPQPSHAS